MQFARQTFSFGFLGRDDLVQQTGSQLLLFLQSAGHFVKGTRQFCQFITCSDRCARVEMTGGYRLRRIDQGIDRGGDETRQQDCQQGSQAAEEDGDRQERGGGFADQGFGKFLAESDPDITNGAVFHRRQDIADDAFVGGEFDDALFGA